MQINSHSLSQLDEAYLRKLSEEALVVLSVKLLEDLKEARERLNQNSQNSSKPPSQDAPWQRPQPEEKQTDETPDNVEIDVAEKTTDTKAETKPAKPPETKDAQRKRGKVTGMQGFGRQAPERVDLTRYHPPEHCLGCQATFDEATPKTNYTGYYEIDFVKTDTGWQVKNTLHRWQEATCGCGHTTRQQPPRRVEDGVAVGGFKLIGSGLATLIIALSLRYRLSRSRIQEFLHDWLGVDVSVGSIHAAIEEAAVLMTPVEAELIETIQQSALLHADETPWPEQDSKTLNLWLWVFVTTRTTLYFISHRGKELTRNLLSDYQGTLMSDGWQAYRWLPNRLRCWAHLQRKAKGLTESFDNQAQAFGQGVLALWKALRKAVYAAREEPPQSIRSHFEQQLADFRGRCEMAIASRHAKTHELATEFLNDWDAIFAVLENPHWPLTNNEAERALRHWVILRKITHGTRTERGSRGLALLASVIDTCRQRNASPWDYLRASITLRRQNLPLLPLPG
jgi:transposase